MGCGVPALAILDDGRCRPNQRQKRLDVGAEAGNLCYRYTALVCRGKPGRETIVGCRNHFPPLYKHRKGLQGACFPGF